MEELKRARKSLILGNVILWMIVLLGTNAVASVVSIGPFTPSTLIDFTGLSDGTEVNGLTVSGVLFTYSLGNDDVEIDGGPGVTNNINPPNIVSIGNDTGTLTLLLPSPATMFEYGYAILNTSTVVNATTVSVFSGATLLGSLSYTGVPDPLFTGGFAGLESTTAFNRVTLTFNSAAAPAFAVDNIGIANVPEPSTFALVTLGLLGCLGVARSGRSKQDLGIKS
jgi:PEP-CTERM motif